MRTLQIAGLVFLAGCLGSHAQFMPFDVREATISTLHQALLSGHTTCRNIVTAFLYRIERFNPMINAFITLNPDALETADALDEKLASGNFSGRLFCVPLVLKDNFDAVPMPTTGGCMALKSLKPTRDSPTVTAFRREGAVILGKTNLQEMGLDGLTVSSLGGQTVNPYDWTRTPGGSSGGTGAAVAASLAVLGTGTDTVNSLRSPASANSLFSFRPTRGLISRTGVIPVSHTQDAIGAIGKSLMDIAVALTVMQTSTRDPDDNTTDINPMPWDYTAYVEPETPPPFSSLRVGVIEGFFNRTESDETTPVNEAMLALISLLRSYGAVVIEVDDPATYNATTINNQMDVQQFEYRDMLTSYLSSPHLTGSHPQSMPELYSRHKPTPDFLVPPMRYRYIEGALHYSTDDVEYKTRQSRIANLTRALHATITSHDLTCLIYPEQMNLVVPIGSLTQHGRNGLLAAVTGSPVIVVPIGFSPPTESAPIGVPIGMEILGLPWSEPALFKVATMIDQLLHARRAPETPGLDEAMEATHALTRVPDVQPLRNIPTEYPLGVF